MCGIAAIVGPGVTASQLEAIVSSQRHRGPDATGTYFSPSGFAALGHNRLSIIDLSEAGRQPMSTADGRLSLAFNGEIYNYLEIRESLSDYPFRSRTDSEVLLAAFERWGSACLDRLVGMFAFAIWDDTKRELFCARDRFGVKPLYYHREGSDRMSVASEIKAFHAAGVPAVVDPITWASYLDSGHYGHGHRTFWDGIHTLPPGHALRWKDGDLKVWQWYDLVEASGRAFDDRPTADVADEYLSLMRDSIRLRFRSDVPVGINLSGGLDSSVLLALVRDLQGADSHVQAFTFATGDPAYDETPWVRQMLEQTSHPWTLCPLRPEEVPALAASVQESEDEPFGGLPTLAYARLFEHARDAGVTVLLDGQGMDEQWAGYDYYRAPSHGNASVPLQGSTESPVRPCCLTEEFRELAQPLPDALGFDDRLRRMQHRDATLTKIPRALRFNDRVSMRVSLELREPFLDHRLVELALRQPADRKIADGTGKWLLRQIVADRLPCTVVEAPKRPLQTPQREWLRGPLLPWASELVDEALNGPYADWFNAPVVRSHWDRFRKGRSDNSFYVWQWISLGLTTRLLTSRDAMTRGGR